MTAGGDTAGEANGETVGGVVRDCTTVEDDPDTFRGTGEDGTCADEDTGVEMGEGGFCKGVCILSGMSEGGTFSGVAAFVACDATDPADLVTVGGLTIGVSMGVIAESKL